MLTFLNVKETRHIAYLHKARECFQSLQISISSGRHTSTAMDAVHLVIFSINALSCYYLRRPALISDHSKPAGLLDKLPLKRRRAEVKRALKVFSFKEEVERGTTPMTKKQSFQMAKAAERVYAWAKENLPKQNI